MHPLNVRPQITIFTKGFVAVWAQELPMTVMHCLDVGRQIAGLSKGLVAVLAQEIPTALVHCPNVPSQIAVRSKGFFTVMARAQRSHGISPVESCPFTLGQSQRSQPFA